jgi:carbon-monoxide dehydrogenase medium subunit
MKPPPFTYHDPKTVAETLDLLASKENAKLLAGGQSLMPMLNFRYVLPDHVIDINKVAGLDGITAGKDAIRIGAMTRQRDVEYSEDVAAKLPILTEAILNVGHRQTRNRGTVGGSLAHLDPSAEIPTIAMAVGATIHVEGKRGKRDIPMAEFPVSYMTPAIELDELITGVTLPLWPAGHGYGFVEFARRHGDFAITSAAALLELDASGRIRRASVTVSGVGPSPVRCTEAEKMLIGETGSDKVFRAAAETTRKFEALEDIHASSKYRQHLATVMSRRALEKAQARATEARGGR